MDLIEFPESDDEDYSIATEYDDDIATPSNYVPQVTSTQKSQSPTIAVQPTSNLSRPKLQRGERSFTVRAGNRTKDSTS